MGTNRFDMFNLVLEPWTPKEGYVKEIGSLGKLWVRIEGLPVHLWEMEILEQVGDACDGFLNVNAKTKALATLQ